MLAWRSIVRLLRGAGWLVVCVAGIAPPILQGQSLSPDLEAILFPNQDDLRAVSEKPVSQTLGLPPALLAPLTLRSQSPSSDFDEILFPNQDDLRVVPVRPISQALGLPPAPITLSKHAKTPLKYDVSKIGDRGVEKGVNFYSYEREQALGKELSSQLEATSKLLNDPVVCDYVNKVGQRLVRYSDAKIPFTIKVIDDDQVNAFALPGGYFYVNSGLILAAQTEAELAGVMAHEIAHVAARHATKGATRTQIWNLASMSLVFVGGPVGMAVRQVSSLAVPMTFMKFSRNFEREADLLGIEYEYAAGYDPQAFIDFFERIASQSKKPNIVARAFDSHPMNQDRIRRAQKEIESMLPPHDQYLVNTSEFDEVKAHLLEKYNVRLVRGADSSGDKPVLHRRDSDPVPGGTEEGPKQ
jgi:hypothetical protein